MPEVNNKKQKLSLQIKKLLETNEIKYSVFNSIAINSNGAKIEPQVT